MQAMAGYKQPRKINFVSITLWLLVLSLGYGAWKFGPPYYRRFSVKSILDTTSNRCRGRLLPAEQVDQLEKKAEREIRALGIEGTIRVKIEIRSTDVRVVASYAEVVHHPFVERTTTVEFRPEVVRPRVR
jgi:hypothetical protein